MSRKRKRDVTAIALFEVAHEIARLATAYETLVADSRAGRAESIEIQRRGLALDERRRSDLEFLRARVRAIEQREPA